jgi:tetratricopeptide (TPR) repeat protein
MNATLHYLAETNIISHDEIHLFGIVSEDLVSAQSLDKLRGMSKQDLLIQLGNVLLKILERSGDYAAASPRPHELMLPVFLLFENCQWMDEDSWFLIKCLIDKIRALEMNVTTILVMRPTEPNAAMDKIIDMFDTTDRRTKTVPVAAALQPVLGNSPAALTKARSLISTSDFKAANFLQQKYGFTFFQLQIDTMSVEDTRGLIAHGLGFAPNLVSERLVELIDTRAKGSPLHINALVEWAKDHNHITTDEDGICTVSDALFEGQNMFPASVKDAMLALLDDVPSNLWEVLKVASCVGFQFSFHLLLHAMGSPPDLLPQLDDLVNTFNVFEEIALDEHGGTVKRDIASTLTTGSTDDEGHGTTWSNRHRGSALGKTVTCSQKSKYHWRHHAMMEAVQSLLIDSQKVVLHERIAISLEAQFGMLGVMGAQKLTRTSSRHVDARKLRALSQTDLTMASVQQQIIEEGKKSPQDDAAPLKLIAHHWECAGNVGKAITYMVKAGSKARDTYRLVEAVALFTKAMNLSASNVRVGSPASWGKVERSNSMKSAGGTTPRSATLPTIIDTRSRQVTGSCVEGVLVSQTPEASSNKVVADRDEESNFLKENRGQLFDSFRLQCYLGDCLRQLARYDEAQRILQQCNAEITRVGEFLEVEKELMVNLHATIGMVDKECGRYKSALQYYDTAIMLAREVYTADDSRLAHCICGYAELLRKVGRNEEAAPLHRQALSIRMRAVGEMGRASSELDIADSQTKLACTIAGLSKDKVQTALELHQSALFIRQSCLNTKHPHIAESLNYCADSMCGLGMHVEGLPLVTHALVIREEIMGKGHPAVAHCLSILASCFTAIERFFEAEFYYRRCLRICEDRFRPDHPNLIPNLMGYGKTLQLQRKFVEAFSVYERAYQIHIGNFENGQRGSQLATIVTMKEAMEKGIKDEGAGSTEVFTPNGMATAEPPSSDAEITETTTVVVISDPGRDSDDEVAMCVLASLSRKKNPRITVAAPICPSISVVAAVATLEPAKDRARLMRGSFDVLGLGTTPVGIGSDGGVPTAIDLVPHDVKYMTPAAIPFDDGQTVLHKTYEKAAPKSITVLVIASMKDLALFMRNHEGLFVAKTKSVAIMGGVMTDKSGQIKPHQEGEIQYLVPDTAYNNYCDMDAAHLVYRKCQELNVQLVICTRHVAYGCPVNKYMFDMMAETGHVVARQVMKSQKSHIQALWKKVNLAPGHPRREKLPDRCNREWFMERFLDGRGEDLHGTDPIWGLVENLSMYDPLTAVACVPSLREKYFVPCPWKIGNTEHLVIGLSGEQNGIKDQLMLEEDLISMVLHGLESSLNVSTKDGDEDDREFDSLVYKKV